MPKTYFLCLALRQAWDSFKVLSAFLKYRHMVNYADICIIDQYFSNIWKEEKPVDRSHSKIIEALERKDLSEAQRILIFDIELMKDMFF